MADQVVHFEIMGKDAEALRAFYRQAFDWQIAPPFPGAPTDYSIVAKGGDHGIGGGIGRCPEGDEGHVTFYVYVSDIPATLAKIASLGGKNVAGPFDVPNGPTIALFEDPEGHRIGLVHDANQSAA